MPCRGEKSVAVSDQRGKKPKPLATSPDSNTGLENTSVENKHENASIKSGENFSGSTSTDQKQENAQTNTQDENKENNNDTSKTGDKPEARPSGLCRGSKSVQVKEQTSSDVKPQHTPADAKDVSSKNVAKKQSSDVDKDNTSNKTDSETSGAPRKSGLCRSNTDVDVIESNPRQQRAQNTRAVSEAGDPTTEASANDGDGQENKDEKSTGNAKSGGFCSKKSDVAVKESSTKASEQRKNSKQEEVNQSKASISSETKQKTSPEQATNRNSGTCCSGRSVEVKESLRPLERGDKKAEPDPKQVADDSFGEPIYSGLEDLDISREDKEEKKSNEESFEEIDDKSDDDSVDNNSEDKIILHPEPPPPKLKKKKKGKKKKGSADYVEDTPPKGGALGINPRKGKYSVTPPQDGQEEEEEPLYTQVEKSPTKKKQTLAKQAAAAKDSKAKDSPSKMKKKKLEMETSEDIRSVYENQIASLAATSGSEGGFTLNDHPTVEEESELLENAEAERKKNKQRLREKKLREAGRESPVKKGDATTLAYENAQKEIDRVLAPKIVADDEDEDDDNHDDKKKRKKHKDKSKKNKKEKDKDGEDNEAYSGEEKYGESLEEAKARMHQLLDDAFSLFSHSRSSISNKVAPSKQNSEEKHSPKSEKKDSPRSQSGSNKSSPRQEVYRFHHFLLLHYPRQTNLSTQPPQQEKLTTSTFTETLPASLRPNYYTTQPAEPIVIKSRELGDPNNDGRDYYLSPRNTASAAHTNGSHGAWTHPGTFQNPLFDGSSEQALAPASSQSSSLRVGSRHGAPYHQQPVRHSGHQYEPYYGLSSYQEIPQSSTLPGQADEPYEMGSSLRHREASSLNGAGALSYSNSSHRNGSLGRSIIGNDYHPTNNYYHHEMLARPVSENFSRPQGGGAAGGEADVIHSHTAPQRGENPNIDVVDAITGSLRPGASPQPLISSLREEVQALASRRAAKDSNSTLPPGATTGGSTMAAPSRDKNGSHSLR
ncbi:hypothetical protein PoB_006610000 [Plakobranchus ocellatus]|uniref:Uncharacterized protein n=1 Tax=Plakobranchus ocellatus TaxID=259542 RepID=A0AAV4D620_9GAST|nr:hypothetical protein PoB_006610000 [Plakobranchus ocellatus]